MTKVIKAESKKIAVKAMAERILAARGDERETLLAECDEIAAVVPLLPPEELLFTLREADRDAAVTILSHARTAQLQAMLDLELWDKDRLRPERAQWWVLLMEECGEKPLAKWLKNIDYAELSVLFAPLAKASFQNEEGEPPEGGEEEASFSLDGVHFFTVPAKIEPAARKILTILRMESHQKYLHVLET
ncbi:hypothetical protein FDZ71_10195, partial [bacterium]